MYILTIRTDKPEAELGLYEDDTQLAYCTWQAHRQLAETIHIQIKKLLDEQSLKLHDLGGIVAFKGPGSFTGLRIGLSVANALAASVGIPIVSDMHENWREYGGKRLLDGQNEHIAVPEYGALPNITQPKH